MAAFISHSSSIRSIGISSASSSWRETTSRTSTPTYRSGRNSPRSPPASDGRTVTMMDSMSKATAYSRRRAADPSTGTPQMNVFGSTGPHETTPRALMPDSSSPRINSRTRTTSSPSPTIRALLDSKPYPAATRQSCRSPPVPTMIKSPAIAKIPRPTPISSRA